MPLFSQKPFLRKEKMMQQRKKLLTRYNIGDYRVRDKKKRYNNFNLTLTATNEKTWSYYNRRIKKAVL